MSFGGAGMTNSARSRANVCAFFFSICLSATLMIWMLWRFPLGTTLGALAVISVFALLARLARSVDGESLAELNRGNQGA